MVAGCLGPSSTKIDQQGIFVGTFQSGEVYEERTKCAEKQWGQNIDLSARFVSFYEIKEHLDEGEGILNFEGDAFPIEDAKIMRKRGGTLFIKLEPWSFQGKEDETFTLKDIAAGVHDKYLIAFAKDAKSFGEPVFVTFGHEMNGINDYPWANGNAEEYKAAYRHVHEVISRIAPNITWVWNADVSGDDPANYYPEDDVVDWIAFDGYDRDENLSAEEIFKASFDEFAKKGKPLMVGEFATTRADKAAWLQEATDWIAKDGRIKGFVYFDVDKEEVDGYKEWKIRSQKDRDAFKQALKNHEELFRRDVLGRVRDFKSPKIEESVCEELDKERVLSAGEKETYEEVEEESNPTAQKHATKKSEYGVILKPIDLLNEAKLKVARQLVARANYYKESKDQKKCFLEALRILGILSSQEVKNLQNLTSKDDADKLEEEIDKIVSRPDFAPSKSVESLEYKTKGIKYIPRYFDLLLLGADILRKLAPKAAVVFCEQVIGPYEQQLSEVRKKGELYQEKIRYAHQVESKSISGMEALARLLMGQAYQEDGDYNRARKLYDKVIEWGDRELTTWRFANRLYLYHKGAQYYEVWKFLEVKDNVLYLRASAILGKGEVLTKYDELFAARILFPKVLLWEKVGKKDGYMDLGLKALIGLVTICLIMEERMKGAGEKAFFEFFGLNEEGEVDIEKAKKGWQKIDTYKDLKKVLALSGVKLAERENRLRLVAKKLLEMRNTLSPELRRRIEDIKPMIEEYLSQ